MSLKLGVLALQGAFELHVQSLRALGEHAVEVRTPFDLDGVDALVLPGGESTTMSMLLDSSKLFRPIAERLAAGMPALGTCAGMILLSSDVADGRPDQKTFATLDLSVRRNGYGRQIASFEDDLIVDGIATPFRAVFIRAPLVEHSGTDVEVLATIERDGVTAPVAVRQGPVMATAFHPELSDDLRVHELFLRTI